jgi:transposase
MNEVTTMNEREAMLQENRPHTTVEPITEARLHGTSLHPRLAWIICYNETGSAQDVCRKFGISRKTFYKWLKRYRTSNGDSTSLSDRSRRPHRFPRATPEESIRLLKKLKEETGFGQRRLRAKLLEQYNISLSERTIWKILKKLEREEAEFRLSSAQEKPGNINIMFSSRR